MSKEFITIRIEKQKLKLISTTLYRAYSLPYKRKNYPPGCIDITHEQTEKEKDVLRRSSLAIDRILNKNHE